MIHKVREREGRKGRKQLKKKGENFADLRRRRHTLALAFDFRHSPLFRSPKGEKTMDREGSVCVCVRVQSKGRKEGMEIGMDLPEEREIEDT